MENIYFNVTTISPNEKYNSFNEGSLLKKQASLATDSVETSIVRYICLILTANKRVVPNVSFILQGINRCTTFY